MKLQFSTTTFNNVDLKAFYNNADCKFFIFQYEFNEETSSKHDLLLKCYFATDDLTLLNEGRPVTGEDKWEVPEIKVNKGFVIGNITIPKNRMADFFPANPQPHIIITPVPDDQNHATYISLRLQSAALATLVVNPSPPARST